jgi:hypothetical protein
VPCFAVHSLWSYKDADERARIRKAAFEDKDLKDAGRS